ncbi:MAG: aminotransferase class I/II-fold pyridoxal phosphate-dependent enzyme [Deltaproteobacteria bacterium]|nr:aminotransferase class I/II-fold pyridoxal phosphate-dependent enzyme [Deltaproteobacteria bacterium]
MTKREPIPPFRYMVWAKRQQAHAAINLAASCLAPPDPGWLTLGAGDLDLAQRGYDMPPEARQRLADRFGVEVDRLMLTLGSSHGMYLLCASSLRPGDLCLVERPAYELLPGLPGLFGAEVERFERTMGSGYRLPADLPARIAAERPRLVLMTNPHNPSGALLSTAELAPIAEAVAAVGGRLVVDEVYLECLPDAPLQSAHRLGPAVAVASSFTKAFGLGTVRFGWVVAAPEPIEEAIRYNDYISVLYPNPCAWVGLRALDQLGALQARAAEVRRRNLPILEQWVADHPEVSWHPPEAGVIAFPRVTDRGDVSALCDQLLRDHDTLVVPGSFFGAPGHIRIGFGMAAGELREGLSHLSRVLTAARG